MNRRELLAGGLVAGATLALPARGLAQGLAPVFAQPSSLTPYQQRILGVARRELDRVGARVWRQDIVGIADFAQPSAKPRFHFANVESGTVRSFYVSHGRGSDPEHCGMLQQFSNVPGSYCTSRGAYLTCEWYTGKYGTSIRLDGMDPDNSYALDRAIVMHPADYARPSMISTYGKLGRSEGCFAMAPEQFSEALLHLSGGRLLYADRIGEV